MDRIVYPDFETLYKHHDKISIGYKENEMAEPADMLIYYSKEKVEKYGALALIIELTKKQGFVKKSPVFNIK